MTAFHPTICCAGLTCSRVLRSPICYGIRSERRLCEEVVDRLTFRWFCRLDLDDKVPDHSTFSKNRHGRFRDSDVLRHIFERVVLACIAAGLVGGEGFAVDASLIAAADEALHAAAWPLEHADLDLPQISSPKSRALRRTGC